MRNIEEWVETKFTLKRKVLSASRDSRFVGLGSRFMCDLLATVYGVKIPEHATGRLLDVGCGQVPLFGLYREAVVDIVCIDWRNSPHETSHLDIETDLNQGIPQPDASFDTVIATDVMEHIEKPEHFFGEMTRVLKPLGKLVLGVPFLYWLHETPYDFHRYTEFKLEAMCRENGLRVLSLTKIGGANAVILDILLKRHAKRRLIGPVLLGIADAYLKKRSKNLVKERTEPMSFPIAYCLVAQKPA